VAITYVFSIQMDHVSSFYTYKFQGLFNYIMNYSVQWVLTPEIFLWRFNSSSGFQLPKWEFTWECGGSFFHTLAHSLEHKMWFLSFHSWPAPSQALALVTNPRLKLWQLVYVFNVIIFHLSFGPIRVAQSQGVLQVVRLFFILVHSLIR
jgi:hypothetical protein